MTGARFKKYRYHAPRVLEPENTRPDFNERAIAFKTIQTILSKQATLNPTIAASSKPKKEDTDGKKRTQVGDGVAPGKKNAIIWDPGAKRKPGQFFKHWVTYSEAFRASQGLSTKPNYGWVSPSSMTFDEHVQQLAKKSKVEVTKYRVNPETNEIIKSTGVEVKSLGRTIGERNPAGKLINRAGVRAGLVVDALGRLRCPPGVPAANQFTDVTGANCFQLSIADIASIVSEIGQVLSTGKPSLPGAMVGITNIANVVAEARGLRSRTSLRDRAAQIFNGLKPSDKTRATARQSLALARREERMKEAITRRKRTSQMLLDTFGIDPDLPGDRRRTSLFNLVDAMSEAGMTHEQMRVDNMLLLPHSPTIAVDPDSHGLSAAELSRVVQATVGTVSANSSMEDKLKAHESVFVYAALRGMGYSDADALRMAKDYVNNVDIRDKDEIDKKVGRMWDAMGGMIESFAEITFDMPDKGKRTIIESAFFEVGTQGQAVPGIDSKGNPVKVIQYNPLETLQVTEAEITPLNADERFLLTVKDGATGTDAEQAMAIAESAAGIKLMQDYGSRYAINLATAEGGFEERGVHFFTHEFGHTLQMDAVEDYLAEQGIDTSQMTAQEYGQLVINVLAGRIDSGFNDGSQNIEALIESNVDILAGKYSAELQYKILKSLRNSGGEFDDPDVREMRAVAFAETTTELWALRRRGVISGENVDDAVEYMDRPSSRGPMNFIDSPPDIVPPASVAPDLADMDDWSISPPPGLDAPRNELDDINKAMALILRRASSPSIVHEFRTGWIQSRLENRHLKRNIAELSDDELREMIGEMNNWADKFQLEGDDPQERSMRDMADDLGRLIALRQRKRELLRDSDNPPSSGTSGPNPSPRTPGTNSDVEQSMREIAEEMITPGVDTPGPATPVNPDRKPDGRFSRERKDRRSRIHEKLSKKRGRDGLSIGRIPDAEIEEEKRKINIRLNGDPNEYHLSRGSGQLGKVRRYMEENYGTTDLRELDENQLNELKAAMRVVAEELLVTQYQPGSGRSGGKEVERLRSEGQSIKRFLSSIDDMADLQAYQEHGPEIFSDWDGFAPINIDPASVPRIPFLRDGQRSSTNPERVKSRIQSVKAQRNMSPEQSRAVSHSLTSDSSLTRGDMGIRDVSSSLKESAEIRRLIKDSAITPQRSRGNLNSVLLDERVQSEIVPLLTAMQENPTSVDTDIDVDLADIGEIGDLRPGTEINHTGFIKAQVDSDGLRSVSTPRKTRTAEVVKSGAKRTAKAKLKDRIKDRAVDAIAERIGLEDDDKEVAELVVDTVSAMRYGPQAALTKLGIELAKRGSREAAESVVEALLERGKINEQQARFIMSAVDKVAPEGLPEPIKGAGRRVGRRVRAALDSPENRDRIERARDQVRETVQSASDGTRKRASAARERARRIGQRTGFVQGSPGDEPLIVVPETDPSSIPLPPPPPPPTRSGLRSRTGMDTSFKPEEWKSVQSSVAETKALNSDDDEFPDIDSINTHSVGGEKIMFGAPDNVAEANPDVTNIPINPFSITGLSEESEEGRRLARLWMLALADVSESRVQEHDKPNLLLFMASRGDSDAMRELEQMAKSAEKKIAEMKDRKREQHKKIIEKEREARQRYVDEVMSLDISDEEKQRRLKPSATNGYSGLSIDDLYVVHETTHTPPRDEEGNISLRPTGEYITLDENGNEYVNHRGSIHMTLNHRVAGHNFRETPRSSTVLITPLRDLIEANPGSLDNLFVIDTWFTPEHGRGLVLPKDKVKTVDIAEGEDGYVKVDQALKDMGVTTIGGGAEYSGSLGADDRVLGLAAELGVDSVPHFGTAQHVAERTDGYKDEPSASRMASSLLMSNVSEQATMRHLLSRGGKRWMGSWRRVSKPSVV